MFQIHQGDCLNVLPTIADNSIDAIITDPPYAEVKRPYGTLTEVDWHTLMNAVVVQAKRVLKPQGSAVFILQPNSRHVGEMRLWLWEFLVRTAKNWNLIQDVYWWNTTTITEVHSIQGRLLRPSVKYCLWFGPPDCYRNQDEVMWTASQSTIACYAKERCLNEVHEVHPGGHNRNSASLKKALEKQNGKVRPFNLLPIPNSASQKSSGAYGHGAGTPFKLADWWTRYLTRAGDTILDPFNGAGTMGLSAVKNDRHYIGIEKDETFCAISRERIADV